MSKIFLKNEVLICDTPAHIALQREQVVLAQ